MGVKANDILAFVTGVTTIPPLGFASKPKLFFTNSVLATASTCDVTMHLPRCHRTYQDFKEYMTEAIISAGGYGMA